MNKLNINQSSSFLISAESIEKKTTSVDLDKSAEETQSDTSSITKTPSTSSKKATTNPTSPNHKFNLRWNYYQTNLTRVFNQLLKTESFVDVTLVCDGHQSINAHKMILSACSPFFEALFNDHPHQHPIIMLDVKWPELKAIVDFMYTGEINVNQDQISPVLRIAEMLKVRGFSDTNEMNGDSSGDSNLTLQPHKDKQMGKASSADDQAASSSSTADITAPLAMKPLEKPLTHQSTKDNPSSLKAGVSNARIGKEIKTGSKQITPTENPWVAQKLGNLDSIDDEYLDKFRAILNTLTLANFDNLIQSAFKLPINSVERMRIVTILIFEKTVSEITFASAFYRFCKILFSSKYHNDEIFKVILISHIQKEFEDNVVNTNAKVAKLKPLMYRLAIATDLKEKQDIKTELDEQEFQFRRRAWGTVSFIAELGKMGFIRIDRVCKCVESLLEVKFDDQLEFMCKLLIAAGHQLEIASQQPGYDKKWNIKERLDNIFAKIEHVIKENNEGTQRRISNRVEAMLQDIVELRARFWNQEKFATGPFSSQKKKRPSHSRKNSDLDNSRASLSSKSGKKGQN